ncbi:MAG: peptidylprolyl isomerase [Rhodothermales bacterium]
MTQAQTGHTVNVHYTGKLEDGTVFDSSKDGEPLQFTLGAGEVIPGFEGAVLGLEPGQSRTATVLPEAGYGPRREDLIIEMSRDHLPSGHQVQIGQHLQLRLGDGDQLLVVITEVTETTVTFDANHPLAGQTLIFEIELLDLE